MSCPIDGNGHFTTFFLPLANHHSFNSTSQNLWQTKWNRTRAHAFNFRGLEAPEISVSEMRLNRDLLWLICQNIIITVGQAVYLSWLVRLLLPTHIEPPSNMRSGRQLRLCTRDTLVTDWELKSDWCVKINTSHADNNFWKVNGQRPLPFSRTTRIIIFAVSLVIGNYRVINCASLITGSVHNFMSS